MMACLGKCFGKSPDKPIPFSSKSHPGAERLNQRLRANLNMPPPSTPRASTSSTSAEKPLPPLPEHGAADDVELQERRQQRQRQPQTRISSTRRSNTASRSSRQTTNTTTTTTTTTNRVPIALPWETSRLAKHELTDMYNEVHRTMGHIPYVVSGVGALIDHGFTGRTANKVTIIVPEESRGVVRAWAAASGTHDVGAGSDSVAIRMPKDGSLRRVRVRWVSTAAFGDLEIVGSSCSRARVLGLASQIDQISTAWLQYRERLAAPGLSTQRDRERFERELKTMVGDIFWCLRRAADTRTALKPEYLRLFLSEKVWGPFTQAHEDARFEAQRAGIDVAAVLAGHRQRGEVRAHDELLRQYGIEDEGLMSGGGIVDEQPGPFEGMRGLGRENRKDNGLLSVYTVATTVYSDAGASSVASEAPPPMPPPKAAVSSTRQVRELPGSSSRQHVRELPAPSSRLRSGLGGRREEIARQRSSPAPGRMSLEERGGRGGRGGSSSRRGELGRSLKTAGTVTGKATRIPEKEVKPERQSQHQARHSVEMVSGRGTPEHWL
ncbi:hypothetical protein PG993_009092 [Apiospora rasikravindrae]|uniref:Uncharacterized protein n=1 Tax=Apiospora rasikravindrae TaxID=990691 RepID=A0ABR1SIG6_9PEZI